MKRGRPTKLTPETQAKVVQAISLGAPYELAALYAGLNRDTVWRWIKKGEAATSGQYRDFSDAVKEAEGKGVVGCLAVIRKAGQQQWQAAAWMLERRYPDLFGRSFQNIEHSGEVKGGDVHVTLNVNPDEIKTKLERRLGVLHRAGHDPASGNGSE